MKKIVLITFIGIIGSISYASGANTAINPPLKSQLTGGMMISMLENIKDYAQKIEYMDSGQLRN